MNTLSDQVEVDSGLIRHWANIAGISGGDLVIATGYGRTYCWEVLSGRRHWNPKFARKDIQIWNTDEVTVRKNAEPNDTVLYVPGLCWIAFKAILDKRSPEGK